VGEEPSEITKLEFQEEDGQEEKPERQKKVSSGRN
jgi:hypothetical protein